MKVNVVTKVTITASPHEVYNYLSDLKYAHLWNPQIKVLSSRKPLQLNSTYETTSQILGVMIHAENVVTKYIPDEELQIENTTGTVHYMANFKLSSLPRGATRLTCTTTVSSESKSFAFTTPVLKLLARRELQSDLQALKIAAEQHIIV